MRFLFAAALALIVAPPAFAAVKVNANISIGGSTQSINCTDAGAIAFDLPPSGLFRFTCNTSGINYRCQPTQAISYDPNTLVINVATTVGDAACSNGVATGLIVDGTIGGVNSVCSSAINVSYTPSNNRFDWTCGTTVNSCFPTQTVNYDLGQRRITVICGLANPSGIGNASPSSIGILGVTLLTVAVTPGNNPISSGLAVTGNLSAIGGSSATVFHDDGLNGDLTAGDKVFSFQATVAMGTTNGVKSLPTTISDAQGRTGSAPIALTVIAPTDPSGVGSATPSSLAMSQSTLLTVATTPGLNPPSTGITVSGNLSTIGGSASQAFFDDGSNGDAVGGDGVFSYQASVPLGTTPGGKSLPISINDGQGRSASTNITLTVLTPTNPTAFVAAVPDNVAFLGNTLLQVWVAPGANPTSSGVTVTANLTGIGGSSAQALNDQGLNGDVAAGDNIFSFSAAATPAVPGSFFLPVSVADAQGRVVNRNMALYVVFGTDLAASGVAVPAQLLPGSPTLLEVTVTPATSPASTGLAVSVDLSQIGGDSNETFYDDGTHGDLVIGDNVFSFSALVSPTTNLGPKSLQATVIDQQARVARTGTILEVRGTALFGDGFE